MAVRIRMARFGRRNRPFFRIGVYHSTTRRNGRCLENLGWLDPLVAEPEKKMILDLERVNHWLACGAMPTEKTASLLKQAGVNLSEKPKEKAKTK